MSAPRKTEVNELDKPAWPKAKDGKRTETIFFACEAKC